MAMYPPFAIVASATFSKLCQIAQKLTRCPRIFSLGGLASPFGIEGIPSTTPRTRDRSPQEHIWGINSPQSRFQSFLCPKIILDCQADGFASMRFGGDFPH